MSVLNTNHHKQTQYHALTVNVKHCEAQETTVESKRVKRRGRQCQRVIRCKDERDSSTERHEYVMGQIVNSAFHYPFLDDDDDVLCLHQNVF